MLPVKAGIEVGDFPIQPFTSLYPIGDASHLSTQMLFDKHLESCLPLIHNTSNSILSRYLTVFTYYGLTRWHGKKREILIHVDRCIAWCLASLVWSL